MIASRQALLNRLRGAAGAQAPAERPALDVLTGAWDPAEGLPTPVERALQVPAPRQPIAVADVKQPSPPKRSRQHGKKRTIYLDEQAEQDLMFLLSEPSSGRPEILTRSEGVRRALRAARAAIEVR